MNHITIVGRVVEDPVRKEVNDSVVCTFRIASGRTGTKTGRLWIDIEAWSHLAGICYQHLTKGRDVLVAGRLTQKQWADTATSEKRTRYLITARVVELLPMAPTGPS
jgi:single stranded DNA-binding protein